MSNPKIKNVKYVLPVLLLMIGGYFSFIAATMTVSAGFTFNLFTAGPIFLFLGISTIIAPVNIPDSENSSPTFKEILSFNAKWKWVIWIVALISGVILRDDVLILFAKWFG